MLGLAEMKNQGPGMPPIFNHHSRVGKRVHAHVVKLGLHLCDMLCQALVDMYRNYGDFENEGKLFDEMPTWGFG